MKSHNPPRFSPIVQSSDPITLVGGGQATPEDLHKSLMFAPVCVGADGGAALAIKAGVEMAAVIGDFDSIDADILAQVPAAHQHRIAEQDSTDFEKALLRIKTPLVLGVGFCGARVDHQLAALNTLVKFAHQPCVLLAEDELIFVAPPHITLPTKAGDVVSLFPMGRVTGRSTGLHWPIDGLEFRPGYQSGTSNHADGPITVQMDAPGMLMIVPRRFIQPVVEQLSAQTHARWPARVG
jgi:thiamine pyrophosphokinase